LKNKNEFYNVIGGGILKKHFKIVHVVNAVNSGMPDWVAVDLLKLLCTFLEKLRRGVQNYLPRNQNSYSGNRYAS
jgi:hypothetical protein